MFRFEYIRLLCAFGATACLLSFTSAQSPGYYQVQSRNGAWWFLDSGGQTRLLLGLNHLHLLTANESGIAPVEIDKRSAAILSEMGRNGFNTLGFDADADLWHRGVPFTILLGVAKHVAIDAQTEIPDVFDSRFESRVQSIVSSAAKPRSDDRDLVGYFSDDNLDWAIRPAALMAFYLRLAPTDGGHQEALEYLRLRYNTNIGALNRAWGQKNRDFEQLQPPPPSNQAFESDSVPFALRVMVRYFQVCADAIHSADPNHLFLGANAVLGTGDWREALSIADVVSVTWKDSQPDLASLSAAGKPLIINLDACQAPPKDLFGVTAVAGYFASGENCSVAAWAGFNQLAIQAHQKSTR